MHFRKHLRALYLSAGLLFCGISTWAATEDSLYLHLDHPAYLSARHDDTLTFECSGLALLSLSDLVVENSCVDQPQVSVNEQTEVFEQPHNQTLSVMSCAFTAVDDCQRRGRFTVHLRLVDTTAPLLQGVPQDLVLAMGETLFPPPAVYAIDNCTANPTVSFEETRDSTATLLTIRRAWTALDDAGNVARQVQTIEQELLNSGTSSEGCDHLVLFDQTQVRIETFDCEKGSTICLPLTSGFSGSVTALSEIETINQACGATPVTAYRLAELFNPDDAGPFEMIWRVGMGAYRARIAGQDSLLAFVETFVTGWTLDVESGFLYGPAEDRFHDLSATSASTRSTSVAEPQALEIEMGHAVTLPVGSHQLIATHDQGCQDTLQVDIACRAPAVQFISAVVGTAGSYCLPGAHPEAFTYTLLSEEPTDIVLYEGVSTEGCLNFMAESVGEVVLTLEHCDLETGICGRTEVHIEVFRQEDVKPPSAAPDLYAVGYNGQRVMHVLANDEVVGGVTTLTVDAERSRGEVRVDLQHRVHYTATQDWCGNDRIFYTVCNAGGCDTASVKVQVTCEDLIVFNGFSPNADGVNDYFEVLGIENYPENSLMVFNQHGHEVFKQKSYLNDWDGTYRGTPLTDGTYFYVLTVKNTTTKSGYVQIRR